MAVSSFQWLAVFRNETNRVLGTIRVSNLSITTILYIVLLHRNTLEYVGMIRGVIKVKGKGGMRC